MTNIAKLIMDAVTVVVAYVAVGAVCIFLLGVIILLRVVQTYARLTTKVQ